MSFKVCSGSWNMMGPVSTNVRNSKCAARSAAAQAETRESGNKKHLKNVFPRAPTFSVHQMCQKLRFHMCHKDEKPTDRVYWPVSEEDLLDKSGDEMMAKNRLLRNQRKI